MFGALHKLLNIGGNVLHNDVVKPIQRDVVAPIQRDVIQPMAHVTAPVALPVHNAIAGAVRQVSPFDNGATHSHPSSPQVTQNLVGGGYHYVGVPGGDQQLVPPASGPTKFVMPRTNLNPSIRTIPLQQNLYSSFQGNQSQVQGSSPVSQTFSLPPDLGNPLAQGWNQLQEALPANYRYINVLAPNSTGVNALSFPNIIRSHPSIFSPDMRQKFMPRSQV